jgi:hypothetical protein
MTRVVEEMEESQIARGIGEWPRPRTGKLKVVVFIGNALEAYYVNCTHSPYKTNVKVDRMGNFCGAIDTLNDREMKAWDPTMGETGQS